MHTCRLAVWASVLGISLAPQPSGGAESTSGVRKKPAEILAERHLAQHTRTASVDRDHADSAGSTCTVLLADVYAGGGLAGVPRGTVKRLRIVEYSFGRRGLGGLYGTLGMDGPRDIPRILGTVPVAPDGSAYFIVPAKRPVAWQPLDDRGQALQLMRSWLLGGPSERLSCSGCHETPQPTPPQSLAALAARQPADTEPWHGPPRGLSFVREIQPVLDRYCISCHCVAKKRRTASVPAGPGGPGRVFQLPDFTGGQLLTDWSTQMPGHEVGGGQFTTAYAELQRFVRRPGIESEPRMLRPLEYHVSTTELGQMFRKGHHGVVLDAESWERLAAWIDLNSPFHGTWHEVPSYDEGSGRNAGKDVEIVCARTSELRRRSVPGPLPDDGVIPATSSYDTTPVLPEASPDPAAPDQRTCPDWPFSPELATQRQQASAPAGTEGRQILPVKTSRNRNAAIRTWTLELAWIPPGEFLMGSLAGHVDERPLHRVQVSRGFWISRYEITNEQFREFAPQHDSRTEDRHGYQRGVAGYDLNQTHQPVVRVSWDEALAFCQWLSTRTGRKITLPTEVQWEWACRAGSQQPFWYGDLDTNFAPFANLGDATLADFAGDPSIADRVAARFPNPNKYDNWIPQDARFNDGGFVTEPVGKYAVNPWGLGDMHGNASEWTRSAYRPYPCRANDGRDDVSGAGADTERVVRGGSWYDRPYRGTASFRLPYRQYQPVYNVGFRIIIEE